ncbi:MAG: hypothetical protein AB1640_23275 [bacterium]
MDFDHAYADYLKNEDVARIEELEKATGTRILAYYTAPEAAHMTEAQLQRIKELERKLCVRLVAYKTH